MHWIQFEAVVEEKLIRELKPQSEYHITHFIDEVKKLCACLYSRDSVYTVEQQVEYLVACADDLVQLDREGDYFNRGIQLAAQLVKENAPESEIPKTLEEEIFDAIDLTYANRKHKSDREDVTGVFLQAIGTIRGKRSGFTDSNTEKRV